MTQAARIAWVIIGAALLGWIATWWMPERWWVVTLRHACEGAFVGGVCDAFAIWKVYGKVEDHFDRLTDEVADTFIEDMVKPEEVVAELSRKLHEPAFARDLLAHVETLVPEPGTVRGFLEDVWQEALRDHVVEWLVQLDLGERIGASAGDPVPLWRDELIRRTLHRCAARAVSDPAITARLYRGVLHRYGRRTVFEIPGIPVVRPAPTPVSLETVARYTVDESELHGRLIAAVDEALGQSHAREEGPLAEALRAYAQSYADAWSHTEPEERRAAAERLVDLVSPRVLDALSGWIWEHRTRLGELSSQDLPLNAHPLVEYVSDEVGGLVSEQLEQLDERSQALLTDKLRAMGPKPFRAMLERRTRPELDWIQVNGAGLGFFLGLAAGIVAGLAHP